MLAPITKRKKKLCLTAQKVPSGRKQYSCNYCNDHFKTKLVLIHHKMSQHAENSNLAITVSFTSNETHSFKGHGGRGEALWFYCKYLKNLNLDLDSLFNAMDLNLDLDETIQMVLDQDFLWIWIWT